MTVSTLDIRIEARRWLTCIVVLASLCVVGCTRTATLTIDHADQSAVLDGRPVADGGAIALRAGERLDVRVIHTNTALYDIHLRTEATAAPQIGVLKTFLGDLGTYLIDVPTTSIRPDLGFNVPRPRSGSVDADMLSPRDRLYAYADVTLTDPDARARFFALFEELERLDYLLARHDAALRAGGDILHTLLQTLNTYVHTGNGQVRSLRQIRLQALVALDSMALAPAAVEPVSAAFRQRLGSDLRAVERAGDTRWRLRATDALTQAFTRLDTTYQQYQGTLAEAATVLQEAQAVAAQLDALLPQAPVSLDGYAPTRLAGYRRLAEETQQAVADADAVLTAAYDVEALATRVVTARAEWDAPRPYAVSWRQGQSVTVTVVPVDEWAHLASEGPMVFTANLRPDWVVRPAVGLTFTASAASVFPTFGTAEVVPDAEGGGHQVVTVSQQDARFLFLLNLSLTWPFLEFRPQIGRFAPRVAVWVPELLINPGDDVKSFGIGAGLSIGSLSLNAGYRWTKHEALDGVALGQVIQEGAFQTRQTYGGARFFWGVSLRGWPPFLP